MLRTTKIAIFISAALLLPALANAGHHYNDGEFWPDRYARIAVEQGQKNYRLHCGYRGARWTASFHEHRRWAASHSVRKAERELQLRDAMLRDCRAGGYNDNRRGRGHEQRGRHAYAPARDSQRAFAEYYAQTAVSQARRNQREGCGLGGDRWTTDYNRHYKFAYHSPRYQAENEINARERLLEQCQRGYRRH